MSDTSQPRLTICLIASLCVGVFGSLAVRSTSAQTTGATSSTVATDDDAKNELFNSEEWRQTRRAFDNWLSVQRIYDARQVADVKRRLQKKIARASSRELRNMLEDMQEKLEILLSPEAGEV